MTIEDSGGAQYKRITTFVKKFFSGNASDSPVEWQSQADTEPVKSGTENTGQMMSVKMHTQSVPLGGVVAPQMRPHETNQIDGEI